MSSNTWVYRSFGKGLFCLWCPNSQLHISRANPPRINKEIHHHPEYYCIYRMHGLLLAPIIYIIASQPISFQRLFRKTNSVEPETSGSEESTDMKGKKIQKRK